MRRRLSLPLAFALVTTAAGAQPRPPAGAARWADSARVAIEAGQIAGDLGAIRAGRAVAERALAVFPGDPLLLHYQGYAHYREAMLLRGRGQPADVASSLAQGVAALEASARKRPMAETSALLATLYGNQIGVDPSKAMTLGMLSTQLMGEAVALGPANPRVWLLRGESALYAPEAYGGGTRAAVEHLTKALSLFERDRPAAGAPAWGRAEVHAWLGQAHQRDGDAGRAAAEYRAALAVEPGYGWVRAVLLPGVTRGP